MQKIKNTFLTVIMSVFLALCMWGTSACIYEKEYKVSFMVNGTEYETVMTKGNKEIKFPENPKVEGYGFHGWYLDDGVWEEEFKPDSLVKNPISEDLKTYAKLVKIEDGSAGETGGNNTGGNTGGNTDGNTGDNTVITYTITYKVVIVENNIENTYNLSQYEYLCIDSGLYPTAIENGENAIIDALNTIEKDNMKYQFINWYTNAEGWVALEQSNGKYTITPTDNITIYARINVSEVSNPEIWTPNY